MAKCEWSLVDCPDPFGQDCPIRQEAEVLAEIKRCVPFPSAAYKYVDRLEKRLSDGFCRLENVFKAEISDITPEQLATVGGRHLKYADFERVSSNP